MSLGMGSRSTSHTREVSKIENLQPQISSFMDFKENCVLNFADSAVHKFRDIFSPGG